MSYDERIADLERQLAEANERLLLVRMATAQGCLAAATGKPMHTVAQSGHKPRTLTGDAWEAGHQYIAESAEFRQLVAVTRERDEARELASIVLSSLEWTGDGYEWTGGEWDYRMQPAEAVEATQRMLVNLRTEAKQLSQERDEARAELERWAKVSVERNHGASGLCCQLREQAWGRADAAESELAAARAEAERNETACLEVIDQRDAAQDAITAAHRALGGDGDWVAKLPPQEPPESGDLLRDVPVMCERMAAEVERLSLHARGADATMDELERIIPRDERDRDYCETVQRVRADAELYRFVRQHCKVLLPHMSRHHSGELLDATIRNAIDAYREVPGV